MKKSTVVARVVIMQITRTKPKDTEHWLEMRTRNLNSTEVAALFDCSPYLTHYELWHMKKNPKVEHLDLGERGMWGNILEGAIAGGLAQQNQWELRKINIYAHCAEERLGSSFDYQYKTQDGKSALLEIKNVDGLIFKKDWIEDPDTGVIEAPPHIELQAQHELLLSPKENLTIGLLVGGNRGIAMDRAQNTKVQDAIREEAAKFWWSIDNDKPPKPDFNRDAKFIASQFSFAEDGTVMDLSDSAEARELARKYVAAGQAEKDAKTAKDAAKAQLLMLLGDAAKGIHSEFSISAGLVKETLVPAFTRKGYRNFRVNWKSKE